jgi:hypothetical protein
MSRESSFPHRLNRDGAIDSIRKEAGPQRDSYNSSEILISVLRSTSFLLEHYGYSKHDPSLSELQLSLQRATERLAVQPRTDDETLNPIES